MPDSAQTGFDLSDTVTVYVLAEDGTLLDLIEEVDLGDPTQAWANGRTSLKEAALWGALAASRHRRGDLPRNETGGSSS